jgi:TOMM system kinase/cyclase fusion protein
MRYVFADCVFDTQLSTLHRAGTAIRLQPKVFHVLQYLLEQRDYVVTKDELGAHVWPGQFISDATLEGCVKLARQALGDSGRAQRLIQSRRGYGYRFVGVVAVEDQAPSAPPLPEGPALAAAGPAADLPRPLGGASLVGATGPDTPDAERRQLTVLFCDLVESTVLASQLDPEDYREVVRAYHAACTEVIQRFAGHIAQYLGDGLLVYFGYPQAHEDDAQRAVRTRLGLLEAMGTLNARLEQAHGLHLAVRVGIHTGLAVVGTIGAGERQEQLALGATPPIAARLQGLAAPDTVVISAATARLVEGYFVCQPLGAQAMKGVSPSLQVSRVLQASGAQTRLDVVPARSFTPLVGREEEVALLHARWEHATRGQGQVVLLSGEPGIGKSRLVQVLKDTVAPASHTRIEWQGVPYYQHSALHPVIDYLHRRLAGFPDEPPSAQLRTLEALVTASGLGLCEAVPLLATLLALPLPPSYPPLTLTPRQQRQHTFDTLLAWLHAEAQRQPVLVVVEDLHWLDPSTLELLSLLIEQSTQVRLCLIVTARPEFHPTWAMEAHVTTLTLRRLAAAQVAQVATHVAGDKALPAEVVAQIVAKTDGVPLFVEELTKMVLESDLLQEREEHYELSGPLPPLAIPSTLQDALLARLDRLAAAKGVAQLGATIGRTFPYELLQAVASLDAATLQGALAQLVEAEVVAQRGHPPQATYLFKHALIQATAYQSLLKRTRQQYHQRIAQVLEGQFPEMAEEQPELLAHHCTEAGLIAQAIGYWYTAGQSAVQRSALVEAIAHLRQGLELLQTLPETPERVQREVDMLIALGVSLLAMKGFAAPEVRETYTRAQQLCHHLEDPDRLFPVLRGLVHYYNVRAEHQTAHALGEQLLAMAQQIQNTAMLCAAHRAVGSTLLFLGTPAEAHRHFTQGIALYDPTQHGTSAFRYGEDSGVACRTHDAWALWRLGYPDQALVRSREAVTLAQHIAHPLSLGFTLGNAALFHQFRREVHAAQERAEAAMSLVKEQGFPFWVAVCAILRGWVLAHQGQAQEGIEQMHQGLRALRTTGAELLRPYYLALHAEAYAIRGQPEAGLTALAEALTLVDSSGERFCEVELHRLKGALLLQQYTDNQAEAETCFHHALEIARHQQAKSFELRTATSLARLWQQQGKHQEAHDLLAPVYHWFTEGFDTLDLMDAKALLEALA